MAWTTPVTDRGKGAYCLPSDLNRIDGNINYLIGTSLKTDFVSNDFLTKAQWQSVIDGTVTACNKYGIKIAEIPDFAMTSDNFNNVENLLLLCYERLLLWQKQFATNNYASSQTARYVGSTNLYTRGFNY